VSPKQRKAGSGVIEGRPAPAGHRRVTKAAILRQVAGSMIGIGGVVVIGLVAIPARPAADRVITKLGVVTLRAL